MSRFRVVASIVFAVLVLVVSVVFATRSADPSSSERESSEQSDQEERAAEAQERAAKYANHDSSPMAPGAMRRIGRTEAVAAAAPGWIGEIKLGAEDTWEPSIAADPSGPYVYALYNGFNRPKACKSCPPIPMLLRVSSDNGVTWGPETYICPCPNVKQYQYDPVLKVANNGVVYATWMNKTDIAFSKSTNHGATWSAPITVSGNQWADHPWIGVSPNGVDVYVAFATTQDVWVAASHNSGASFAAPVKLNTDQGHYRYPNGLEVLPSGTAVMSASNYPGSQQNSGPIAIETWRTTNGGASWSVNVLANVFTGVQFATSSTTALASDSAGTLVSLYTGATSVGAPGQVWTRRSTDGGATWAPAVAIESGPADASFPAIAGGAAGVFRLHYGDNRTGSWNTWYRSSTDGGQAWGADVDISDADAGGTYKTAAGFSSEYGDYGAIDITNTGKTVAVWGEGVSISTGPGAIWFNRET